MGNRRPRVAIARPSGRYIELRYWCPVERRNVRRSTGTMDLKDAKRQAKQLEAELLTGTYERPLETTWLEFRDRYEREELVHQRDSSQEKANTVLNAVEAILRPTLLADVASAEALIRFRTAFAAGKCSRFDKPRSPHTVKSYMTALIAALHWAEPQGLIAAVPKIPRYKAAAKLKAMKGRPLAGEEFERMLGKVASIVGAQAEASWKYLLRGLWESALRIEEAMVLSWDIPNTIRPLWPVGRHPVLLIPAQHQKNNEEDELPLLPWLERLLMETPERQRSGWVFNPTTLNAQFGRSARVQRPSAEWAGKVIQRIGEAAGVVVEPAKGTLPAVRYKKNGKPLKPKRCKEYTPPKYASAHDLRRSCADRLEAAGVEPGLIARVMRHKSYETTRKFYRKTNTQRDAEALHRHLGTIQGTAKEAIDANPYQPS